MADTTVATGIGLCLSHLRLKGVSTLGLSQQDSVWRIFSPNKAKGFTEAYYLMLMPTIGHRLHIFVEWTWAMFFPLDITHLRFTRTGDLNTPLEMKIRAVQYAYSSTTNDKPLKAGPRLDR